METTTEVLAAFDLLGDFHTSRWGRKGAFANPGFRPFHEELIAHGIPRGPSAFHELWLGTRQLGTFKILYMAAVSLTARAVFSMRGMAGPSPGWSAMCWLFRTASHAGNAATTSWLVAVGTSLIWLTGSIQ